MDTSGEAPKPSVLEATQTNTPQSPAEAALNTLNQLPPVDTASPTTPFFSKEDVNAMRDAAQGDTGKLLSGEGDSLAGDKSLYRKFLNSLSDESPAAVERFFNDEDIQKLREMGNTHVKTEIGRLEGAQRLMEDPAFPDAMRMFFRALKSSEKSK